VRELKAKTSEMLRTVEEGNTVLVTTHGRPTAMLVPVTEDDIEDVLLAYSPKLRKKIEEGLKDIRAGRSLSLSNYTAKRNRKKARTA
jgi:prevent-host-death family protein